VEKPISALLATPDYHQGRQYGYDPFEAPKTTLGRNKLGKMVNFDQNMDFHQEYVGDSKTAITLALPSTKE
jgi:hypothetical protein